MVRRNNEPISGADKAKVRVFFAEVEGNKRERTRSAENDAIGDEPPVRFFSEQKANGNAAVLLQQADVEVVEDGIDQVEEVEALGEEPAPPNARKPRGTGKKVDRNAGLNLVPDLNFRPNGEQALKEFVDEKSPKNDLEVALATVYYMQHVMALPKIGPAHLMTAFKEAGKPIPSDVRQTIRNVKKSNLVELQRHRRCPNDDAGRQFRRAPDGQGRIVPDASLARWLL